MISDVTHATELKLLYTVEVKPSDTG